MGDIIELTTGKGHKNIFYKITSSCINFDVKSSGPVGVGLANKPDNRCEIWVVIGDGNRTSIKQYRKDHAATAHTDILNTQRFNRFWISWTQNFVALGKNRETRPMLQYDTKLPDLKYVTFYIVNNGPPVHWRIELPPIMKEPSLKTISNGKLNWVPGDRKLPDDAVIGGYDRGNLYIIRAKHKGSLIPGAFVPDEGCGYIVSKDDSYKKTKFEVLCGLDYMWVPAKDNMIPIQAVEGGYSNVLRETLYIGRAFYNGSVIPGKVTPSQKVCHIHCGKKEKKMLDYEILINPSKNIYSVENVVKPYVNVNIRFVRLRMDSQCSDDESDITPYSEEYSVAENEAWLI